MKQLLNIMISILIKKNLMAYNNFSEDNLCQQAYDLILAHKNDSNFIILDLRPENMYNEMHIENAIFHEVYEDDFNSWINEFDRNKTFLLYCNMGVRSADALLIMKDMGFLNIYHQFEGIRKWQEKGFPVIKNQ